MDNKIILICLVALCYSTSLKAQRISPEGSFTYTFSAYCLKPIDSEGIFFKNATGGYTYLNLKLKRRSEAYKVTLFNDNPVLQFFRDYKTSDGKTSMRLVAQKEVSAKMNLALLAFYKSASNDELQEFHIIEMDDSKNTFPRGTIRIMNTTGVNVIGSINGESFALKKSQSSQPVTIGSGSNALVSIAARGAERYHLLYRNALPLSKNNRALLIIKPPARRGSLKIGGRLLVDD